MNPLKRLVKSKSSLVIGSLLLSGLLLYFAFRKVDFNQLWTQLIQAQWEWVGLATVLAISHGFIMAKKWQIVLKDFSGGLSYWDAFWSFRLANFFNAAFPARLGEAVRIIFVKLRCRIGIGHSVGAMAGDRAVDLLSLLLVSAVGFLGLQINTGSWSWWKLSLLILAVVVAIFLLGWIPLHRLPEKNVLSHIKRFFEHVQKGLKNVLKKGKMFSLGPLSISAWLIQVICVWSCSYAMGGSLGFLSSILVVTAVSFAVALPSAPGHFGTFEFASIFVIHRLLGFDLEQAASIAVIYHLVQFIPTLLIGAVGLILYRHLIQENWTQFKSFQGRHEHG